MAFAGFGTCLPTRVRAYGSREVSKRKSVVGADAPEPYWDTKALLTAAASPVEARSSRATGASLAWTTVTVTFRCSLVSRCAQVRGVGISAVVGRSPVGDRVVHLD